MVIVSNCQETEKDMENKALSLKSLKSVSSFKSSFP